MNYCKVKIGQVLFWGCKGYFRKHSPLPPLQDTICFTAKMKKKRNVRTPTNCKLQVVWEKKNQHNCALSNSSNLKNTGDTFQDVFGEKESSQAQKTHTDVTSKIKCRQAVQDANQKDLTAFFKHKHFCTYKIFNQLTYKNNPLLIYKVLFNLHAIFLQYIKFIKAAGNPLC